MRLFGVVGQACVNAPTLAEAYLIYQRFNRLIDPYARVDVWHDSTRTVVTFHHEPRVMNTPEVMEMLLASLCTTNRQLSDQLQRPRAVTLRHQRRHPLVAYTDAFESEVTFGGSAYSLEYPSIDFTVAPRGANPTAGRYLERYLADLERELRTHSTAARDEWLTRVRTEIEQCLANGDAREATVAKRLGTSSRSLQRALQERRLSFAELLTEVRQERALALLDRPELSAAEIAFMLGYSDARSFYRWFRAWQGLAPGAYRRARSRRA
jgi:AraC-like DNA-binding protein